MGQGTMVTWEPRLSLTAAIKQLPGVTRKAGTGLNSAHTKIKSSYLDFTCSWMLSTRSTFFVPRKAVMPSEKTNVHMKLGG